MEALNRALAEGDETAVAAAVEDLVNNDGPVDPAELDRVCAELRDRRDFEHLVRVADAGLQRGLGGRLWVDLAQCMIEQGAYTAATAVAEQALAGHSLDAALRLDLLGLNGRVAKDLYLSTGEPDHLRRAVRCYADGFGAADDDQKLWLGINAHALSQLARRRGVEVDPLGIESEIEFLRRATAAAATGDDWAIATQIEAHLLVGLPVPAEKIAEDLGDAPPFVHHSLLRQLQQVWGLPGTDPAVATLAELMLSRRGTGEVVLPADRAGYEKMFDGVWPIPIDTYQQGLHVAGSVCHLQQGGRFTLGTGFVVAGDDLHPGLGGRPVVITNEHVVPLPERNSIQAHEIEARFDAHDIAHVDGFRAVWWSDREELDVAILASDVLDDLPIEPLEPGAHLPAARDGAYVYVVGHPGGAGLQLSVRGNDLLDHDGRFLHYRAPTQKGSSGSPVFDDSWKLIGTHHRGSPTLPALNGKSGTYEGNEGTTIQALRELLAERPPAL